MQGVRLTNFIPVPFDVALNALDTNAHASGDVLFNPTAIALPRMPVDNPAALRGEIVAIQVLDEDAQGQPMDLLFLRSNPGNLGTLNAAVSMSDANAREIIGAAQVTSYINLVNGQQAFPSFDPIPFELAAAILYVAGITRGTPTHTAAGMRLRVWCRFFNIEQY